MDATSIKVVNTATNKEITDWVSSVDGQKLKLTLPDNQALTITYKANINAAPNQTTTINNIAYWEGYSAPASAVYNVDNFSYTTGGTVETGATPTVTVIKMDGDDTSTKLSGATFTLEEVTYENGTFTPTGAVELWTGTTDENGTLTFGDGEQKMEYNTIYRLTETEAPPGYIKDDNPHYFAVVKKVENVYPTFPSGVIVWSKSTNYTYQSYNRKIVLPETGGKTIFPYITVGFMLIMCAASVLIFGEIKKSEK